MLKNKGVAKAKGDAASTPKKPIVVPKKKVAEVTKKPPEKKVKVPNAAPSIKAIKTGASTQFAQNIIA
jgi:hypothetical protein